MPFVLAACARGRADVLVTRNARHFPPECCSPFDLDVQTPDTFLLYAYDLRPDRFMQAIATMLQRNQRPPRTLPEFIESLKPLAAQLVARVRTDQLLASG